MATPNECPEQMNFSEKVFSSNEYKTQLMIYRIIMGLLAVIFNGFFINILIKFPLKDCSGYYVITRRLLKYLASFDLLYGLCILLQILILLFSAGSDSENSYHLLHKNGTIWLNFLNTHKSLEAGFARSLGMGRECLVRGIITTTLLITVVRFIFTVYPLQSIMVVCRIRSRHFHAIFICTILFVMLIKINKKVSPCMGLLICENITTFNCSDISPLQTVTSVISVMVCATILALIGAIWTIASKQDKIMKSLLKVEACHQTKNYKAVKTSLLISTIFLVSNSGPIVNNVVKIACGAASPDPCAMRLIYNLADVFEQWLLPIMTVANCIIYTATNKKIRKFAVWYYERQIRVVWGRRGGVWRRRGGVRRREVRYSAVAGQGLQIKAGPVEKPSILARHQFYDNSF